MTVDTSLTRTLLAVKAGPSLFGQQRLFVAGLLDMLTRGYLRLHARDEGTGDWQLIAAGQLLYFPRGVGLAGLPPQSLPADVVYRVPHEQPRFLERGSWTYELHLPDGIEVDHVDFVLTAKDPDGTEREWIVPSSYINVFPALPEGWKEASTLVPPLNAPAPVSPLEAANALMVPRGNSSLAPLPFRRPPTRKG